MDHIIFTKLVSIKLIWVHSLQCLKKPFWNYFPSIEILYYWLVFLPLQSTLVSLASSFPVRINWEPLFKFVGLSFNHLEVVAHQWIIFHSCKSWFSILICKIEWLQYTIKIHNGDIDFHLKKLFSLNSIQKSPKTEVRLWKSKFLMICEDEQEIVWRIWNYCFYHH